MLHSVSRDAFDVAIVGGGPAGLTAAIYLTRFLRSVVVFDAGDGRAHRIPKSRNCPGFPDGISGSDLVTRLRNQAKSYGTEIADACVEGLVAKGKSFVLATTSGEVRASRVILATGIVDKAPTIPRLDEAVSNGAARLCPVCDAYEAIGLRIGVLGPEQLALREAFFLRDFSSRVTVLCNFAEDISEVSRKKAAAAGIEICDNVDSLVPLPVGFDVFLAGHLSPRRIDVLYLSMGCKVRSELAEQVGAKRDPDGYVFVSRHSETSVRGLYAIGDVAKALNQIAVGFGHAAVAATHIHNALREDAQQDHLSWSA